MDLLLSLAVGAHLGLSGTYNGIHPHIRLEDKHYMIGSYYNSEQHVSFYAGKIYDFGKIDLEIGIVTGYSAIGDLAPMARVIYEMNDQHSLYAAPVIEKFNNDNNLGLVLGYEFKLR